MRVTKCGLESTREWRYNLRVIVLVSCSNCNTGTAGNVSVLGRIAVQVNVDVPVALRTYITELPARLATCRLRS